MQQNLQIFVHLISASLNFVHSPLPPSKTFQMMEGQFFNFIVFFFLYLYRAYGLTL